MLNRNPDNFFAETEQVAFCTAHVVPGIDFSNDPLLAGRIHSYVDTQISRLGGPNFHEIPINAPVAQVHNNQRDGMHRQAIHRGRVSYEPNSLGGGCPFQAGSAGFVSFAEPMEPERHKVRGKAERFADHYTQATLFWKSQTPTRAGAHRQRLPFRAVAGADAGGARAHGLWPDERRIGAGRSGGEGARHAQMPAPMPKVLKTDVTPEVTTSPALSLMARPGDGSIAPVGSRCSWPTVRWRLRSRRLPRPGRGRRCAAAWSGPTLGEVAPASGSAVRWTHRGSDAVGALRRA